MNKLLLIITALLFTACSKQLDVATNSLAEKFDTSIDISKYEKNITDKISVIDECRYIYKNEKESVAVVNFTNNSNFSSAQVDDRYKDNSVNIGFSIIGVGAGVKSNSSITKRLVDPKLASAFIPMIENMLINTGSVNLFEREDYDKIDSELKFQDSGLLDPSSVVDFGKTSGVKYIVTGSIDKVSHNYKNYSQYTQKAVNATATSKDTDLKLAAAAIHLTTSLFDGTTIKTAVTVKIVDVASGKIVFTKKVKNETKLNSNTKPTYSQLVGAVKDNIDEALPELKKRFIKYFDKSGYISKIKEHKKDRIVQISLGSDDAIKKDDKFLIYNLENEEDPLSGKISCDLIPTKLELEIFQVSKKSSWASIRRGDERKIKLLQIVKRK